MKTERPETFSEPDVSPCDGYHPTAHQGSASSEEIERAAAFFRAAGDPSRLQLLERLGSGEACVSELADGFNVGPSTLSQRLRVLRDVGLVQRRRDGRHVYYALANKHVHAILKAALDHAQGT